MENNGVYAITHIASGRRYIGSSINIKKRIKEHLRKLHRGNHHSVYLQNAWNKYGADEFKIEVIFLGKKIRNVEQLLIIILNSAFNMSLSVTAPMMGRKHSPKTLEKFKNRKMPSGADHYMYGKSPSKHTKELYRQARLGTKWSEKTKKKMSKTAKRINAISRIDYKKIERPVLCSNNICYKSTTDAAIYNGVSPQTVCDILKGRHRKTRKGVSFEYI